jgi:hypothetical protein
LVWVGDRLDDMLGGVAAEPSGQFVVKQLLDNDSPSNNRQIRRQTALPAKVTQQRKVVIYHDKKDIGAKIILVFGREPNASRLGGVVDHVDHQTDETIHEVLPCPGLLLQTSFQQVAVYFRESHPRILEKQAFAQRTVPRRAVATATPTSLLILNGSCRRSKSDIDNVRVADKLHTPQHNNVAASRLFALAMGKATADWPLTNCRERSIREAGIQLFQLFHRQHNWAVYMRGAWQQAAEWGYCAFLNYPPYLHYNSPAPATGEIASLCIQRQQCQAFGRTLRGPDVDDGRWPSRRHGINTPRRNKIGESLSVAYASS